MDIVTLAQATEQTVSGYGAIGYGLAAIGPGIGIGILVGAVSAVFVAIFGALNKRLIAHADPLAVPGPSGAHHNLPVVCYR